MAASNAPTSKGFDGSIARIRTSYGLTTAAERREELVMAADFIEPEYTKSDDELKWFGRDDLRRCEPKTYRELRRDGELEEYLQMLSNSAPSLAETLISQGTFPQQAWHWPVRERILHVERD